MNKMNIERCKSMQALEKLSIEWTKMQYNLFVNLGDFFLHIPLLTKDESLNWKHCKKSIKINPTFWWSSSGIL